MSRTIIFHVRFFKGVKIYFGGIFIARVYFPPHTLLFFPTLLPSDILATSREGERCEWQGHVLRTATTTVRLRGLLRQVSHTKLKSVSHKVIK